MREVQNSPKDWRTILALGACALGILYFLIQALGLSVFWLISLINNQGDLTQTISTGLLIWSSILSALCLTPAFLLSFYQLRGQGMPPWLDTNRPAIRKMVKWVILVWPVVVFMGWLIAGRPSLAVYLLGPINVLVAGLPVLWIYNAAQSKLEGGPQGRKWRIFGFSLTIMPVLVILLELLALLVLGSIGGLWLAYRFSVDPQLEQQIMEIVNRLMTMGDDLEAIVMYFEPYILQPTVIIWALAIIGGVMPIIEEIVKPLALWSLAGRKISPQEGFVGGLLCGAGFALIENVLYFTTALLADDWLFMAVGRAGTGVLHMLASGLVGWGLASAWRDRKWVFLGLTTLGAFILHGLWNVLSLIFGVLPLFILGSEPSLAQTLLFNLPIIGLLLLSVLGIIMINRHFRNQNRQLAARQEGLSIHAGNSLAE
jgi:RsiW-degrading membrane proteinase PrsW (M82 family)